MDFAPPLVSIDHTVEIVIWDHFDCFLNNLAAFTVSSKAAFSLPLTHFVTCVCLILCSLLKLSTRPADALNRNPGDFNWKDAVIPPCRSVRVVIPRFFAPAFVNR